MFKKKKPIQVPVEENYNVWETESQFLYDCIVKRLEISLKFELQHLKSKTDGGKDYIKDSDVNEMVIKATEDVLKMMSESYKNLLTRKYFNDERQLNLYIMQIFQNKIVEASLSLNKSQAAIYNSTETFKKFNNSL